MSEYMAQKADEQIGAGISERERMYRELEALRAERDELKALVMDTGMRWQPITDQQKTGGVFLCWLDVAGAVDAFYMNGAWHDPGDSCRWSGEPTHWLDIAPPDSTRG